MDVKKDNLLKTFPKWGRIFKVEADFTVKKIPVGFNLNVFHFTKGGQNGALGNRIPNLNLNRDGKIVIVSSVSGNHKHRKFFPIELNTKYHLVIQQYEENGKIMFQIIINGVVKDYVENTQPLDFDNVKVYVSNPWMEPFNSEYGLLENFKFD